MPTPSPRSRVDRRPAVFATTRWSLVVAAGRHPSSTAQSALATLCESYWEPIYAFIRRCGHSLHDAEDLTQEFVSRLLTTPLLRDADPTRGRFRSYLIGALRHFLSNQRDRACALKRGGHLTHLSLDYASAENFYSLEPEDRSAEQVFDRRWALTLLDRGLESLREDYSRRGKATVFEALKDCISGDPSSEGYAALGQPLGMSGSAVKVAVHRLRSRYRQILREEIAQTVGIPDEVEAELKDLLRSVATASGTAAIL